MKQAVPREIDRQEKERPSFPGRHRSIPWHANFGKVVIDNSTSLLVCAAKSASDDYPAIPKFPNPKISAAAIGKTEKISATEIISGKSETNFYKGLWKAIEEYTENNRDRLSNGNGKVTQLQLGTEFGIKLPDLSAIKLLGQGEAVERKPARASVEMLAERFGLLVPK